MLLKTLLSMFMLKKQLLQPAAISTPENRLITTKAKVSSGGLEEGYY